MQQGGASNPRRGDAWSVAVEALVDDVLLTAGMAEDPDLMRAA